MSYADAYGVESNMLTPYGGGQRNSTGAIDLDLFTKSSSDYSVTWKQYLGSSEAGFKVGVLLRGDTAKLGDGESGYVEGMMNGYLFIAYSTGSSSEFRIYRSTDSYNIVNRLTISYADIDADEGEPMWYRASVSGDPKVDLLLEYSTDNVNWKTGATATDNGPGIFTSGATQLIWGLGLGNVDYNVDDIIYNGFSDDSKDLPELLTTSVELINDFNYMHGAGPSYSKPFKLSCDSLTSDVVINSTSGFEVAVDSTIGFTSSLHIPNSSGRIDTTVYVRMGPGLPVSNHKGTLVISSDGILNEMVDLEGKVDPGPKINVLVDSLKGFEYNEEEGPSDFLSFNVSGDYLESDITIEVTDNYEISLNPGSGYSSSLLLDQADGKVNEIKVYVRLKSGLFQNTYAGTISLSSDLADMQMILLSGNVDLKTSTESLSTKEATVVSVEYYTITGRRIKNTDELSGFFIAKKQLSDGTIVISKIHQIK